MTLAIQAIFCNPPIAVARLGGSTAPLAAYTWTRPPNPRADGETVIAPQWSLNILTDGSVDAFMPDSVRFRDGDLIRPVCPFIEMWARMGEAGSNPSTWSDVPLTPALLAKSGMDESALLFRVDARNAKAARRRNDANLAFGTFPRVEIRGNEHGSTVLNGVSPPGAQPPMIPAGRSIPLGSVQVLRSRAQPAAGAAPWVEFVNVEVIRLRVTPGRGRFYGPPRAAQATNTSVVPAVQPGNAFLDAAAGWFNRSGTANPFVEPGDTFDETADGSGRALGVVDDTCEMRIDVELKLPGRGQRTLNAHANIFCGPPDFAPDRRPFLSLADEINDRTADATARSSTLTDAALDAWVEDLFERVYETVSLTNLDALQAGRSVRLTGQRLAPAAIAEDGGKPADRAMGSRDALRNRDLRISAASDDEPLPMSEHARERHRSLSDIQQLKNFVAGDPGRLRRLIRAPFEVEPGETANLTTMRMPPFMRQSNAMPLTLAAWQYDLLMRWLAQVQAPAAPAAAPALVPGVPRALSEGAARRREHVLRSMGREPSP